MLIPPDSTDRQQVRQIRENCAPTYSQWGSKNLFHIITSKYLTPKMEIYKALNIIQKEALFIV